MKIVFFRNTGLIRTSRGRDKVMVNAANLLSKTHDVTLITNEAVSGRPIFSLSPELKFINIGGEKPGLLPFGRMKRAAAKIRETVDAVAPDIVVFGEPDDLIHVFPGQDYDAKTVLLFTGSPKIILGRKPEIVPFLRRLDACVTLTVRMEAELRLHHKGRAEVIPALFPAVTPPPRGKSTDKRMTYFARLDRDKNHAVLLWSFASLVTKYPNWLLDLYGWAGPADAKALQARIDELGLTGRAMLHDDLADPREVLSKTDLAPYPSLREHFSPDVMAAMAYGLPVLGFADTGFVNEVIVPERNGLLARDHDDFRAKLDRLMGDHDLRKKLGDAARESLAEFGEESIRKKWDGLFASLRG